MRVFAPGRVNLIGDHTDYTSGWVLPMAVQLGTTVTGERGGDRVRLDSTAAPGRCDLPCEVADAAAVEPAWARYVAGVVAELRPAGGFTGRITSTLPLGAGLSSSASLEVAVALALGADRSPVELARLCQRAEHRGPGVPCGIMDQLAVCAAPGNGALLIDCRSFDTIAVPLGGVAVFAVHCGEPRRLADGEYAARRRACEAAERTVGPLRDAHIDDLAAITDESVRRRARHVITENARVLHFVEALAAHDYVTAGALMAESHRSLRDDFEVSTPALDALVQRLRAVPGVLGVRLTGAGFGGCVVVLADPDTDPALIGGGRLEPTPGALVR